MPATFTGVFGTPRGAAIPIGDDAADLAMVADGHSPLLGAALAIHAWLHRGGDRPPLRAALARYWVCHGVTALPYPLVTGAAALAAEIPWARPAWVGHFLEAVAAEAEDGLALLHQIERHWFAARQAVAGRRRNSHAAAAIDILAAAPLLSATSLAQLLGIAIKNAIRLLDGLVVLGVISEVTHRSKRRLYGLKHLAPLRAVLSPAAPAAAGAPAGPAEQGTDQVGQRGFRRVAAGPVPLPSPCPRSPAVSSTLANSTASST